MARKSKHDGMWFLSAEHERLSKEANSLWRKAMQASSRARSQAWAKADKMEPGKEADDVRHGPVETKAKTAAWQRANEALDASAAYYAPRMCMYPAKDIAAEQNRLKLEKAKLTMRNRRIAFLNLTDADKDSIRAEFGGGGITQVELARKYGVTQPDIAKIVGKK